MVLRVRFLAGICLLLVAVSVTAGCSLGGDDEVSRAPSGEDVVLAPAPQDTTPTKTVTDAAGAILFEVPESWTSTTEWASTRFVTDVLASTDTNAFKRASWGVPAIGVSLSRSLAESLGDVPDSTTLAPLLNGIIPRAAFESECDDRRSTTFSTTGTDLLSQTVGLYFDYGLADTFTGCGSENATFTDLVALSDEERIVMYMQLQVPSPTDQAAVDSALRTLDFIFGRVPGAPGDDDGGPTTTEPAEKQAITGPLDEAAIRKLIPATLGGASHGGSAPTSLDGAAVAFRAQYNIKDRRTLLYVYAYESPQAAVAVLDKPRPYPVEAFEAVAAQEGSVSPGGKNVGRWRLFYSPGASTFYPGAMVIWTNGAVFARVLIYDTSDSGDKKSRTDEALALFRETPF